MDDLYGDLENYNVDNTISELQIENKELKCKLQEYAYNLDTLQKDFDNLSKEYKKLEQNYSSLLKTAKAEIERKTQIIANLNLEKDKMVLKCFQNKKDSKQCRSSNSSILPQTHKLDVEINPVTDDKVKHYESKRKLPLYHTTARKDQDNFPLKDTMASSYTDLRGKLTCTNSAINDSRTEKSCDAKENIMKHINRVEVVKPRSSIINRRKSMPALSAEMEQFSSDDDEDNKMVGAANQLQPQIYPDHGISERPRSRISETSSLEERRIGYEAKPDSNNTRYSRFDREQNDRFKVRHKSSHRDKRLSPDRYSRQSSDRHKKRSPTRYKRQSPDRHKRQSPDRYKRHSPDRYHSGSREYQDNQYFRSELDRHRPKERVLGSPPRDIYHQRISREPHRNIYERNQYREQERLPYQSHKEAYSSKRRNDRICDDSDTKKAKLEQRHVDDRKMQCNEVQFSSCESPDYDNLDISNQQVKEIKLIAATKLDDPRISSKKYILQNNVDQVVLSTAIGRNIDIVPLSKIAWGIEQVSMPEALLKIPSPKSEQSIKHMCMEIENPEHVSLQSGEISDLEDPQKVKIKVPGGDKKKPHVPVKNVEESKDEKVIEKMNTYKIPKLKKTLNIKDNIKNTKETNLSRKLSIHSSTSKKNDKHDSIKNIDINKQLLKQVKEEEIDKEKVLKEKESIVIQSNSQLPFIGSYPIEPTTDRTVVENDLELSDDNCDAYVIKDIDVNKDLDIQTIYNSKDINLEKQPINTLEELTPTCQDRKPISDVKKSKSKKKTKHKEETKSEDTNEVFSKPSNKNDKVNDHRTIHIKTKFSELFDDSSSLISPEDLGVAAMLASTTKLPDKSVPFFEDAMDATDLNPIKLVISEDSIPILEKLNNKEKKPHSNIVMDICNPITQEPKDQIGHKPAMTDDDIANIYKNLEPGDKEREGTVVQTVVISTGVQPPALLEVENQMKNDPALQIKTVCQDVVLKALATSTPHKLWQPDINTAARDTKLIDASCDSNNDSQKANVENTVLMNKSDSNTIVTQSAEIPDVRIFVKRRKRKVAK